MIEPNNLYLGDCYELIKQIPDKSIDLIITDPPYEIGHCDVSPRGIFKYKSFKAFDEIAEADLHLGFDYSILNEYCRVLKHIYIYIWCNKAQVRDYLNFFAEKNCNFEIVIWNKTNVPPFTSNHFIKDKEYCLVFWEKGTKLMGNRDTLKTVYVSTMNVQDKKEYLHPTIKPINIIKNFLINSTIEGDVVLDTFAGSGTVLKACQELNRQYIGFEINEKFYNIAKDRLNNINAKGEVSLF